MKTTSETFCFLVFNGLAARRVRVSKSKGPAQGAARYLPLSVRKGIMFCLLEEWAWPTFSFGDNDRG